MRESASPTGVSLGRILATPISSSGVRPGACVALARKQAICGRPMPTTTVSPSLSSRAPAATMISVERISDISIAQDRIGLEACEMRKPASFFEIFAVVLGAADIGVDIIADALSSFGMLDIELQMRGVVIIAAEDRGRMRAEWLVDDGLDAVAGNDGAFGCALNLFRRHDGLRDDDEPMSGLGLLLILPARPVDAAIAVGVRGLHMHEGD